MTGKSTVATDKARIVAYCDPLVKNKLETLASVQMRTLSNLVETILVKAVAEAEATGKVSTMPPDHTAKDS